MCVRVYHSVGTHVRTYSATTFLHPIFGSIASEWRETDSRTGYIKCLLALLYSLPSSRLCCAAQYLRYSVLYAIVACLSGKLPPHRRHRAFILSPPSVHSIPIMPGEKKKKRKPEQTGLLRESKVYSTEEGRIEPKFTLRRLCI